MLAPLYSVSDSEQSCRRPTFEGLQDQRGHVLDGAGLRVEKMPGTRLRLRKCLGQRLGMPDREFNIVKSSIGIWTRSRLSSICNKGCPNTPTQKGRTLSTIYRNAPSEEKVCLGEQRRIARDRPANACLLGVWNTWSCSLYISVA